MPSVVLHPGLWRKPREQARHGGLLTFCYIPLGRPAIMVFAAGHAALALLPAVGPPIQPGDAPGRHPKTAWLAPSANPHRLPASAPFPTADLTAAGASGSPPAEKTPEHNLLAGRKS